MGGQLLANVRANLLFYRRNNLLLLMVLLVVGVSGLNFIPALIFENSTLKFNVIRNVFSTLNGVATVVAAMLGLLAISHHLRNRCLKMVVTKPCSVETWLLGVFLSGALVTGAIHLLVFLVASSLFVAWGIPFQWGLPYLAVASFLQAMTILSYLAVLAVILHPVLAVLVAVFFQDAMFRQLITLAMAGAQDSPAGFQKFLLQAMEKFLSVIYHVLPSFGLFSDRVRDVSASYRVSGAAWQYLSLTFAYTAILCTFFYVAGAWALRRKRLT